MSFKNLEKAVVGLCNDVMGDDVIYTHGSDGTTDEIKGVFDNAYIEVEGIMTLAPTLRIKLEDLSSEPGNGDSVEINSVSYRVVELRPDGYGGSTLILHEG